MRCITLVAFVAVCHLAGCAHVPDHASFARKELPVLSGTVYVYDGDSIFFGRAEVRLNAIDAPELAQTCKDGQGRFWPCRRVARDTLRRLIGNQEVHCAITGKDKYRRLLGTCYVDRRDLNEAMVRSGNAIAYLYFSDRYARAQSAAKREHAGIWQDAGFTDPYYCRHKTEGHRCYGMGIKG